MAVDQVAHWQEVDVVEVGDAADGIRRVVLRYAEPQVARPGAHVDVRVPTPDRGTLTRSYSVVESLDGGRRLALSVHRSAASRGGSVAMHALVPGDRLRATQPLQNFPLGVGASRYVVLAGGIGITAVLGMARALKARRSDYDVHYVGRTRAAMAYVDQLAAEHGDRVRLAVDAEGTPLDVEGLLDDIAGDERAASTELYMCGPIRLMDAVRRGWERRVLPVTNLRFETFGNSGSWAPQDFVVRVPAAGVEVRVDASTTMLEALERAGVDMMWDCRKGECGLCQVKVTALDGQVDHRDVFLSADEKAGDDRLCACVSRAVAHGTPRIGDTDEPDDAPPRSPERPAVVTIETT